MFQNPFSFEGRIRRLEYGLSYLIYTFLYLIASFTWQEFQNAGILFYPFIAVLIWFLLAQGAKRCHDLGSSGFLQFIPLYVFFMLFQEGQNSFNKFGGNPKESQFAEHSSNTGVPIFESNKHSLGQSLLRLSSPVLINVLLVAILLEFLNLSDLGQIFAISISIVPCFFLALLINYQGNSLGLNAREKFRARVVYSALFYVLCRLYTHYFRSTEIYVQTILFELIIVALFISITYLPTSLYTVVFRKSSKI